MIRLTKGSNANVVLTLNEKRLSETSAYMLIFTHIVTKEKVTLYVRNEDDLSPNPARYNEYNIDASVNFGDKPEGFWLYEAYEMVEDQYAQAEPIEVGRMYLAPDTRFSFVSFTPPADQPFKVYDGK